MKGMCLNVQTIRKMNLEPQIQRYAIGKSTGQGEPIHLMVLMYRKPRFYVSDVHILQSNIVSK